MVTFLDLRWECVFSGLNFRSCSNPIAIDKEFVAFPAERLRPKVYVFSGERESRSQFACLRRLSVRLSPFRVPTKLLFAFRERDRQAARRLAVSLRGLRQQGQFSFPGLKDSSKLILKLIRNQSSFLIFPNRRWKPHSIAR